MLPGVSALGLMGGTAAIGVIISAWSKIKVYLTYIWGLFFIKTNIVGRELKNAVLFLLREEFTKLSFNQKKMIGIMEYVRPRGKNQIVAWKTHIDGAEVWRRGRSFLTLNVSEDNYRGITISHFRGDFNIDELIQEAIDKYNLINNKEEWRQGDRFRVIKKTGSIGESEKSFNKSNNAEAELPASASDDIDLHKTSKPLFWDISDIGQPNTKTPFNDLYYSENINMGIKEAILWRDSENWFKSHNIPWKRGFLLSGSPGTGKSAFVRALGQELNMPILLFDVSTMTNSDFNEAWESALNYSPCIVLFEDIDAVFKGRKNIAVKAMQQGLSFDFMLNTIDGVQNADGIFKIITTNHPESIDPALGCVSNGDEMSTRPGRIDRVIHFGPLTEESKRKMAKRILGDFPKEKWEYVFAKGENDTGAQFQERCSRIAMSLFWEKKDEK